MIFGIDTVWIAVVIITMASLFYHGYKARLEAEVEIKRIELEIVKTKQKDEKEN